MACPGVAHSRGQPGELFWLWSQDTRHGWQPLAGQTEQRIGERPDVGLQELAVACLDLDSPDVETVIEHDPTWVTHDEDPASENTYIGPWERHNLSGVMWTLERIIADMKTRRAAERLEEELGPHFVLEAHGDVAGAINPLLLAGTFHGYSWTLRQDTLRVAPPGYDPDACPWWTINGYDIELDLMNERDAARMWLFGVSDRHLAPSVRSLFAAVKPAVYRYWFPETFRGKDTGWAHHYAQLPDGTRLWRGDGHTLDEARADAESAIWLATNQNFDARKRMNMATTRAWHPGRLRKRNRGRLARLHHRITLGSPIAMDERDFTAWPSPATLAR